MNLPLPHSGAEVMKRLSVFRLQLWSLLSILCFSAIPVHAQGIEVVGQFDPVPGTAYADIWGEGDFAYLATQNNGVFIIDISNPASPQLASHYGPGKNYQDVKVANGIGYFGGYSGVGVDIVDLSDPYAPTLLSQISSANGGFNSTHNIAVNDNFLYLTDGCYCRRVACSTSACRPLRNSYSKSMVVQTSMI